MQQTAADPAELVTALERLTMWLRRHTPQTESASTISALDRLNVDGPLRVSDLAVHEAMTQPGVTILVNRLAEAGYARREPDPSDRRATLVCITETGRAVLRERHAARGALLRDQLDHLDDADRADLLAAAPALERLLATVVPAGSGTTRKKLTR